MAVNKVELSDGTVLMDATDATVTSETLIAGVKAMDSTGTTITGTLDPAAHTHDVATTTSSGFMSAADKQKLDNLSESPGMSYTYGTEDLVAGVTPLASGALYFVYE